MLCISNEELVALIQSGVNVNENMTILYKQNLPLLKKFINPFCVYAEAEDLLQEAYFGLHKAVKDFDPSMDCKFMTYAEYKIKLGCIRYFEKTANAKMSSYMYQRIYKYKKYLSEYKTENEKYPTEREIMKYLNISKNQLDTMIRIIKESEIQSLNEPIVGEENLTLESSICDDFDMEEAVLDQIVYEDIWDQVGNLKD